MELKMELEDRMKKTIKGQVTWANPDMNAKCDECRHFKIDPKDRTLGKCNLVKAFTRKAGVSFLGEIAIACSKFDR